MVQPAALCGTAGHPGGAVYGADELITLNDRAQSVISDYHYKGHTVALVGSEKQIENPAGLVAMEGVYHAHYSKADELANVWSND